MLMVTWTNRIQNEAIVATYNLSNPDPEPEVHLDHVVTDGWIDSVSISFFAIKSHFFKNILEDSSPFVRPFMPLFLGISASGFKVKVVPITPPLPFTPL